MNIESSNRAFCQTSTSDYDAVPLTNRGVQPHIPVSVQGRFGGCRAFRIFVFAVILFSVGVTFLLSLVIRPTTRSSLTPIACHSPTIDRKSIAAPGTPVIPTGYTLVQATVHQRHLDRWMYSHDYIHNVCWTNQLNSTDPIMQKACSYNLSSVWEHISFESDPYATPARGSCQAKQLTLQGINHAEALGEAYRNMFVGDKDYLLCDAGNIKLESDVAQKNQMSTQHIYKGICRSLPDVAEYPVDSVLDDGTVARGRPFFLTPGICDSDFFRNAESNATQAFLASSWIPKMRVTAQVLAGATGKELPQDRDLAKFEDNIEDCVVSHVCHGLSDTPPEIWTVFDDVSEQETASRIFSIDMYDSSSHGLFDRDHQSKRDRFIANYFGYYFVVLFQRMQRAVDGEDSPLLYIQVTSDDRISIMLRVLGAPRSMVSWRPTWGSQLVFQLLERERSFFVRTLYNGEEIAMQNWKTFKELVNSITPTLEDCSMFYDSFP